MKALEFATGKTLYEDKIVYEAHQETSTVEFESMSIPGTHDIETYYGPWVVLDETKIVPHRNDRMFLTYSKEYVKVYDAQTGTVLQTLVEPPIDTSKPQEPPVSPQYLRKRNSGCPSVCVIASPYRSGQTKRSLGSSAGDP